MADKNKKHDHHDHTTKPEQKEYNVQALLKEISELKEQNNTLLAANQTLQKQIDQLNQDYVSKLTAKTEEIKGILKTKEQALEARFADEVKMGIFKIFKYDMDTLLTQINHFSKIVNNQYDDPKLQGFLVGFQMIANQMQAGLSDLSIHIVNPVVGELLDDDTMEVFETIKTDEHPALTILEVISPGYTYDNKTIKFAVVRVAA
ncbi:nucleotide exchange factor GrpE [Ureaplasma miroungigenitalium]|uniref:Nucleotide exchange factor GrpE n=1 Tax=Ureaplasma miroungigenitalium TaxID=1042321 RepID=A0ABT3BM85_9BACT|nr:nucleotide exchange factor GrpE [Ureaplasma miroungigenitalium]MCV3728355.1 nucleotide exchange factor GrpE [Ureaplasma miroungigenitalium]MCV3734142.1 nucleotide exchange factor GrpE [Ureaplasma miroungigenitalium]